jgi:hypothetical protein
MEIKNPLNQIIDIRKEDLTDFQERYWTLRRKIYCGLGVLSITSCIAYIYY